MKKKYITLIVLALGGFESAVQAATQPLSCYTASSTYAGTFEKVCAAGYSNVGATCDAGISTLMNSLNTPWAGTGVWSSYLLYANDGQASGVHCYSPGGTTTAILRCCTDVYTQAPPAATPPVAAIKYVSAYNSGTYHMRTYDASLSTPGTSSTITSYLWQVLSGPAQISFSPTEKSVTVSQTLGCGAGREIFYYSTLQLTVTNSANLKSTTSVVVSIGNGCS